MRSLIICTFFCISVAFTFGNPGKFVCLCVCNYRVFWVVFLKKKIVFYCGFFLWGFVFVVF